MATAPLPPLLPDAVDDDPDGDGAAEAPVALPVAELVEPEPLAAAWNASKVLFALGLMAKTMPAWQ